MGDHAKHRFSITVHSDDLAVVYCLRALAKFSQKTGNNQIPWAAPPTMLGEVRNTT